LSTLPSREVKEFALDLRSQKPLRTRTGRKKNNKMEPITDAHGSGSGFNMQLELEQLQAKVRLLAGGTDGEQLAEVLLDREEELRSKEGEIIELRRKLQSMSSDLVAFEADRTEYEVRKL
jgi:hypothetical protein